MGWDFIGTEFTTLKEFSYCKISVINGITSLLQHVFISLPKYCFSIAAAFSTLSLWAFLVAQVVKNSMDCIVSGSQRVGHN